MRPPVLLVALSLTLGFAGCGDDSGSGSKTTGSTPVPGTNSAPAPTTSAPSPLPPADGDAVSKVERSGKLSRAAVVIGDQAAEAVLIENCLSGQFASYDPSADYDRAAAPPCHPVATTGVVPKLAISGGETLHIVTGAQAGGVYVRVAQSAGDPAAKEFVKTSATADGDSGRRWTIKLPEDVKGADRLDLTVSPNATDSGMANLILRLDAR